MTTLVDYKRLADELKKKREEVGLNMAELSDSIKNNYPGIRISPATISRVEKLEQKDINYTTAFYWNSTLEKLISQKNQNYLVAEKSNENDANPNPSMVSSG